MRTRIEASELLKGTLADILTSDRQEIEKIVAQAPEAAALGAALDDFVEGPPKAPQQWRQSTMTRLPRACWQEVDGAFRVQGAPGASLKYMTAGPFLEEWASEPQFLARERLCRALFDALGPAEVARFGPMLRWDFLKTPDRTRHPFLADVALADSIYIVEGMFHRSYAVFEQDVHKELQLPEHEPTSPERMRLIARGAQTETYLVLEKLAQNAQPGPDNLIVRSLSSIPANRALGEWCRLEQISEQVAVTNEKLFAALNRHGIHEIPGVQDDDAIRERLLAWFGPRGLLTKELGATRSHTGADLQFTMELAGRVQQDYIETRGHAAGERAHEAFGGPANKLLFALVLVACFYSGERVVEELFGVHNNSRAMYPGRPVRQRPLGPHSLELYKSMFGHMAFANTGWRIDPAGIVPYSRAFAHKRAALQGLVFRVFKRWHPEQLLALHSRLLADWPQAVASRMPLS